MIILDLFTLSNLMNFAQEKMGCTQTFNVENNNGNCLFIETSVKFQNLFQLSGIEFSINAKTIKGRANNSNRNLLMIE